jgi:hypothetical protein
LQVIDGDAYATLIPLLYSKASIISRILSFDYPHGIYRPAMTYCDAEKVREILAKSSAMFRKVGEKDNGRTEMDFKGWEWQFGGLRFWEGGMSSVDDAIGIKSIKMDEHAHIHIDQLPNIRDYLDKRNPKGQLNVLEGCLTKLRKALADSFDIGDVLVEIGRAKGAERSSYLW